MKKPRPPTAARVLLVDPDSLFLSQLSDRLSSMGVEVIAVASPARALDVVAKYELDLAVTELEMPGMDGLELREKVMADPDGATIAWALLTASPRADDRVLAANMGIRHVLTKPAGIAKVLEMARAVTPAVASARRPKPRSADEQRERLQALLTKLTSLGMSGHLVADGLALEADVRFRDLKHAFTGEKISGAQLKNHGTSRMAILQPQHLRHLAPIPVLTMSAPWDYEKALTQLYDRHARLVGETRKILERLRIPFDPDDAGFRLVGRARIAGAMLSIVIRDSRTLEVISVDGRQTEGVVDEAARRFAFGDSGSVAELEMHLEGPISALRDAVRRASTSVPPVLAMEEPDETISNVGAPRRREDLFDMPGRDFSEFSDPGISALPPLELERDSEPAAARRPVGFEASRSAPLELERDSGRRPAGFEPSRSAPRVTVSMDEDDPGEREFDTFGGGESGSDAPLEEPSTSEVVSHVCSKCGNTFVLAARVTDPRFTGTCPNCFGS